MLEIRKAIAEIYLFLWELRIKIKIMPQAEFERMLGELTAEQKVYAIYFKEAHMAKGIKLNREQYKNVKRMDHKQMETFVVNMYNAGYEDGKKTAGSRVKPSDIAVAISEIRGIGTKKAAEIMAAVNKLYEGGTKQC